MIALAANHPGAGGHLMAAGVGWLHDRYGIAKRPRPTPTDEQVDDPANLVGVYQQCGARHTVSLDGGTLALTTEHEAGLFVPQAATETGVLRPVEAGVYLYMHPSGATKVIAFDPLDERAEYLYNGHFLSRRTPA